MTKEALKLALDFVETVHVGEWVGSIERQEEVIAAIKEALAQPEQEPVAEIVSNVNGFLSTQWSEKWSPNPGDKLYTTPPQRKPLTDEQIKTVIQSIDPDEQYMPPALRQFARAIEAAHGIKE